MLMLKQERHKKNLTLKMVAENVGVTFQHISLIENNRRKPSWKVQQRLVVFFSMPAEHLFKSVDTL